MGDKIEAEATFAPLVEEVARARHFIGGSVPPALRSSVELVVSELVTNAVRHARTPLTVRLIRSSPALRIEIEDSSAILPAVLDLTDDGEGGRGLQIVEALTTAWGVEASETGKRIWFEIAAT